MSWHGDGAPSACLTMGFGTSEVSKVRGVEAALTPDLTGMAVYRALLLRQEQRRRESRHQSGAWGRGGSCSGWAEEGVGQGQTCHIYCLP